MPIPLKLEFSSTWITGISYDEKITEAINNGLNKEENKNEDEAENEEIIPKIKESMEGVILL